MEIARALLVVKFSPRVLQRLLSEQHDSDALLVAILPPPSLREALAWIRRPFPIVNLQEAGLIK